jgi:hypothetical protein
MCFTVVARGVAEQRRLIYMWEIRSPSGRLRGRYVGKAKNGAKRPRERYARNVMNLLMDKPYHIRGADYRKVHRALAEAHIEGHTIKLYFLCNVKEGENINDIERQWIKRKKSQGDKPWQLNVARRTRASRQGTRCM